MYLLALVSHNRAAATSDPQRRLSRSEMAAHKNNILAVVFAVILLLHAFSNFVHAQEIVVALQDLYRNWSQSTADFSNRLPGWTRFDPSSTRIDPCFKNSWRGVYCFILPNATGVTDATVVTLTISDSSIVGNLPDTLWNFDTLISLTLTGNPNLTGPIPPANSSYLGWNFISLDLHDNGLTGSIPSQLFESLPYIKDLDLSSNRLQGAIPRTLTNCSQLRTLKLSNNSLTGNLSSDISNYTNWGSLITADFSNNSFFGTFPNLIDSISSLHSLNLSYNQLGGNIDVNFLNVNARSSSLAILDLSYNNFTGPMPNLGGLSYLQSLVLSGNKFDPEPIPSWLSNLTSLQTLDLGRTNLTGELDLSLFSSLKQLRLLDLQGNNITEIIITTDSVSNLHESLFLNLWGNNIRTVNFSPDLNVSALRRFASWHFAYDSSYCITPEADWQTFTLKRRLRRCLCYGSFYCDDESPPWSSQDQNSNAKRKIIIGSAVGGSLGAVMLIIAVIPSACEFAEYEMKPTLFSYSELQRATRDFHPDMKLGEGGFGAVFKGTLGDGSVVAVKQLFTREQQNLDDFLNEVILLTSVKHRNLVKLKGCCFRGNERLLVYEFVDNYDLSDTLFEHRGNQLVSWPARFNICLGVAHGLHYLHAGVNPKIIHRDIKANNVLLDRNLHPKIADFGLAMLFPNEDTHITIVKIGGTKGYMAPEYATRGQVSDKIDVFSFGVLALEVVSGRKNISFNGISSLALVCWTAWKLNDEGRLKDLVDPTLPIQNDEEVQVQRVLATALACVQTAPERRPTMAHVVGMLQGDIEITDSVRGRLNENTHHRALLGLTSAATSLMPVDEESEVLYVGENSSSGSHSQIELNFMSEV
ncbi:hypothetical protein M758_10G119500 [Ceratodon purpureus]|nr:hypothetical protein M758_10G119500 [Ceratodon purpureus]